MSNPSKEKGTRAEHAAIKVLNEHTGLTFKRVPLSGAGDIKGDIFLINKDNIFCIEVKHYKDDQFNSKILSSKSPTFLNWLDQSIDQGNIGKQEPLLLFKHDRSKIFIAIPVEYCNNIDDYKNLILYHKGINFCIAKADDVLRYENIRWINE